MKLSALTCGILLAGYARILSARTGEERWIATGTAGMAINVTAST